MTHGSQENFLVIRLKYKLKLLKEFTIKSYDFWSGKSGNSSILSITDDEGPNNHEGPLGDKFSSMAPPRKNFI